MTDQELIDYCDIHCESELALFCREHVERMLKLAGVKQSSSRLPSFMSLHDEMKNLVRRAREMNNSVKFIKDIENETISKQQESQI